jgi:putative hydrolase of the HAD superfamily
MIRAVLIDLDGVIRRWDPWEPDPALGVSGDDVAKAAFEADRLGRVVTGELTDDEWRDEIAHILERDHGAGGRTAALEWRTQIGRIDDETRELVRRLRDVVPVALISNATTRLEADLERLGLAAAFDVVVNSSRVGAAKPDERIFAFAAEQLGVALDECLFIDDTAGHVEAAARLGLRTVHFTDAVQLARALAEYGLFATEAASQRIELMIRHARRLEATELAELHLRTVLHAYAGIFPSDAPPPTVEELRGRWSSALREGTVLAAVVDNAVIGALHAGPDRAEPASGHLSLFHVDPAFSGRGIGGRLYVAWLEHLRELGFSEATLWVLERNHRVRRWYERLGWRATGERKRVYAPAGVDDLRYRLTSI